MTPRLSKRVSIPRSNYLDYIKVAENFYAGANLAREFEYWNAAGVLIIHAAIAYTDACTIKVGGVKSHGDDHLSVTDLVKKLIVLDERGQRALNHLIRMIEQKNIVSYNGEIYTRADIEKLWKHLERYKEWVTFIFGI